MTVRRKALLGGSLAIAMFAFLVSPTQAGTTTLASLAAQVSKIVRQVKNLTSSGTLPSKYVTYKDARNVLPGTSVGAVLDNIAKGYLPSSAIAYSKTNSGLASTTVQGAIDELATTVSKAVSGSTLVAGASVRAAVATTTWKGYSYLLSDTDSSFTTAPEVTVTFTPTTETTGTFSSTPYNAFQVKSMAQPGEDAYCRVGLTGNYRIVGDKLFLNGFDWTDSYGAEGMIVQVKARGNTLEMFKLGSNGTYITYLTKQ